MSTGKQKEKDIFEKMDSVIVPVGLHERQIDLAKSYTYRKKYEGITISDFCSKGNVSSGTWYAWVKLKAFQHYLDMLNGAVTETNEMEAYEVVKQRVLELATEKNADIKAINLYTEFFKEVVDYQRMKARQALGLSGGVDGRTIKEKRDTLLSRLKN